MNKKIKTLYNKALESYTYSDIDGDNNKGIQLNVEKFAELIIQECIKVCQYTAEDVDNGNIFSANPKLLEDYTNYLGTGAYHCIDEIKNHFGI